MIVVGLDASLTCIGWAACAANSQTGGDFTPPGRGSRRLDAARRWLSGMIGAINPSLVLLEDYAYNANGRSHISLGELGGVLKAELFRARVPHVTVPIPTLKKLATGKGNATKEEMVSAAQQRLGYLTMSHDEADARWLAEMGLLHLELVEPRVPVSHLAVMESVKWPKEMARC